jgi:hypothetical protein
MLILHCQFENNYCTSREEYYDISTPDKRYDAYHYIFLCLIRCGFLPTISSHPSYHDAINSKRPFVDTLVNLVQLAYKSNIPSRNGFYFRCKERYTEGVVKCNPLPWKPN